MPEGDTIHRSARTLHFALAGQLVTRFETVLAPLQRVHDDAPITGRRVESVEARGKHLLMRFGGDLVLRTHMRMSGSWHLYRPGERWRRPASLWRILVGTSAFEAIAFGVHDAQFVAAPDLVRTPVGRLGPDLLDPRFDEDEALRRLRQRGPKAIGEVLLDQRVVAGIGNVYKSEVLFLARVHPASPVAALTDETLRGILRIARRLLSVNVADDLAGGLGSHTRARRTTGWMNPAERLWVYDREGRPCRRCATPIARGAQGLEARTTWWCPSCQVLPGL